MARLKYLFRLRIGQLFGIYILLEAGHHSVFKPKNVDFLRIDRFPGGGGWIEFSWHSFLRFF